jgi:hypothetical protein
VWWRRGTHGLWDENLQPIELDEPLVNQREENRGGGGCPSPAATIARRRWEPEAAAAGELGLEQVSGCAGKAKGGAGVRARA